MSRRRRSSEAGTAGKSGAHEKLHASEEQFRLLVESVEEYAIYMLNPIGVVTTWNSGAEKIKGYTAGEIIGKNFACFYTADDVAAKKPEHNLRMAREQGHIRDIGLRVRKDGSTFHAETVLTALWDKNRQLRGFSKVTRDITSQMRAREVEAAKLAAEQASKAKDHFLAALSHELRTPLTPALAAASFLATQSKRLPLEFASEIDTIQRNVQLQARLIDDLLDLTRVVRGKLELHFNRADAHALVRDALEIAHADIISKGLEVTTEFTAKEQFVWADPVRIQQVFWNVINNAVKFTPRGGKIDIRTSNTARSRFLFQISDSGIGIDPGKIQSLFEPFEQADPSITRQFGGLGLGLAISRYIVDLHDGEISVDSRGRSFGTTVKVSLAVLPARLGKSGVKARVPAKPNKALRILLVEDHGDTRRTIARLLQHFGHDISVAETTRDALEILSSKTLDVILSDIGLPDGSGYDVIAAAKRNQKLKGIALTGFGMDEDIARSKRAGFDFHLTKPVDFQELRSVLAEVTSKS
ncbi:MAG TPA: ATP-binding protein [Chthoniobacterales bacterium]|nr:ATP-binding protein [Chthoniobacterales bacterium]